MDTSDRSFLDGRATERGLGLAATVPPDVVSVVAGRVQRSGYSSFWLNNPPRGNALETLGQVARDLPGLPLGVGVIPLSHASPEAIVNDVKANHIPLDRFYLGLGSGSGGVREVEEGIRALRSAMECTIVVAALGPRMCRLAGREADGVLLNWLTPQHAERSIVWVREAAERAGRPVPRLMAYVRAALSGVAIARLREEASRYESIPHYAAHFERMGIAAPDTAATGDSPDEVKAKLSTWDGVVDEVVVRAIAAEDTVEAIGVLADAVAPHAS